MKFKMNHYLAYSIIIIGAAFWGGTGLFVSYLYEYGFTAWEVVAIRLSISSLILFLAMLTIGREYLKVKIKHLPYFWVLGVISIALFNWCYFAVIERASLSIAVIFVYTSPVFAAIIASIFFKEKITLQKSLAILFTITGCGLVIGFIPVGAINISGVTIVIGLFAGLFCSLFSIIGKQVSRIYHPLTVTFYAMLSGSVFMVPTSSVWLKKELFLQWDVWGYIAGISLISTIAAYVLYTIGLSYVESSKATILSAVELVVSVLIGVAVFHDKLNNWQWAGFLFLVCSLFFTVYTKQKKTKTNFHFRKAKTKAKLNMHG
ncbi:DMT family transporter [Sediminibacillus albus]|uniref:Threonine/homoserine efflux transporter RhtA n=1 Tax=Sediminibacillus albus TaxID=407036 RepID=A0A1G8VVH8_9BACI|nr:DMT family transporter [Sediminibacillus albus]SDJ69230.1 Threonine/homoserine efflux transporter RhtA [Sediminibacillus albus]